MEGLVLVRNLVRSNVWVEFWLEKNVCNVSSCEDNVKEDYIL